MPQRNIRLEWRDETARKQQLPRSRDWLRGSDHALMCDVMDMSPALRLPWRYSPQQEASGRTWQCSAVWMHCAFLGNGERVQDEDGSLYADLQAVLNALASDKGAAQHTLLVRPDGLEYDRDRVGGDHHARAPSGRRFTLSVRRGDAPAHKALLAVGWE